MQFVGQIPPGAGNTHTNFTFTPSEHTHVQIVQTQGIIYFLKILYSTCKNNTAIKSKTSSKTKNHRSNDKLQYFLKSFPGNT